MALTRLPVANTLSGTIASTNIANASLNAVIQDKFTGSYRYGYRLDRVLSTWKRKTITFAGDTTGTLA